jgi:acyl-CoA synthetase (AMP-forming)/AMP-acid ligase II
MTTADHAIATRIRAVPRIDRDAPALEYEGRWHSWGALADAIDRVAPVVTTPGRPVGILLRNRPVLVGALLGVLSAGGCVVTINPERGLARTRADVNELDVDVILGLESDVREILGEGAGTRTRIELEGLGKDAIVRVECPTTRPAAPRPGTAVQMLTSGTTGTPKRIALDYTLFDRVLRGAKHYESNKADELRLRTGVAIINAPLVHVSGIFRTLQCVLDGRSFCLLDRFRLEAWLDAVRRHRPRTASLVPTALRMVLAADLDPKDLASLESVVCGTAPLDPDDADAFFRRYGIPVLVSYGATEFGGGVAGWNLADHRAFWSTKRGSVGRAHPGCQLRVVSESDGGVVADGTPGLLEVKAEQLGGDAWTRTTDLARLDADGFLWILGRADHAIIRGGFKVLPETVQAALERHPDVSGAGVIGRPDRRLGAVPVAAVELHAGATTGEADLRAHVAGLLAPYEIPTEIRIVEQLPRTTSGKGDLRAIADLFDPQPSAIATNPARGPRDGDPT